MSDLEEETESNVEVEAEAEAEDDDDYEVTKPRLTLGNLTKLGDDVIKLEDSDNDSDQDEIGEGGLDSDDESDYEKSNELSDEEPDIVMKPNIVQEASITPGDDESDDESSDEDEDYLKKFDTEVVSNYIDIYHPESRMHNYDEVRTLSSVIRDDDGTIVDDIHKTVPFLTKFEKAKILGLRAKQINEGAHPFVKVPVDVVNGYTIAQIELTEKKIPFIIRRPLPNGGSEYWKLTDLENII